MRREGEEVKVWGEYSHKGLRTKGEKVRRERSEGRH